MTPQERRRGNRQAQRAERRAQPKTAPKPPQGPWGPPLGQGEAFDHDPNTMTSYYNPPPQYDFSQDGQAGNFDDPFNSFLAAVPVMQRETNRQIGGALSQAGFTGNRYSGVAADTVADIGAASAERQNAMLTDVLERQANNMMDRQMQAAQAYINASPQVEQAMQDRLGFNMNLAQMAESERDQARREAQQRAQWAYGQQRANFEANKYGMLPFLTKFLSNDLGMTPQPILQGMPGKPGARDTVMDVAKIMAAMYGGGGY